MKPSRETLLAVLAGVVALALGGLAFWSLFRQSSAAGAIEGIITAKQFEQAPETQITVGSGGVHRREVPGDCRFQVREPGAHGRVFTVTVDPKTYAARKVGDRFYFVRPAP